MLFRAVQNGLCAMAEKKSSPEKNEVLTPCPPCPPVSRGGEGRECKVREGRQDHGQWPCQRDCPLEASQPLGTRKNPGLGLDLLVTAVWPWACYVTSLSFGFLVHLLVQEILTEHL